MEKVNKRKSFDFYGYNGPTSGKFSVNGCEYFYGEDYRNKERFAEYKDVGFNILLLQHENSYSGETWNNSACKLCMSEAVKAGIGKIIVSDTRLKDLCVEENLVGTNGKFASLKELDDFVGRCIRPYKNEEGFYGIQLFDEPEGKNISSYGQIVKSIKRLLPKAYVQCNLLNIVESERTVGRKIDKFEAYEEYLNNFLDASEVDYLLFDEYPFRKDYIIGGYSIPAYQIVTKVCKERKIEFRNVLQTWSWINTTVSGLVQNNPRRIFESDLYWQLNMLMGFGCKEYSFFTYFTKQNAVIGKDTHFCLDGASLLNRDGTRTKLYYSVKKIISEMKKFEKIILDYEFSDAYFFFERGKTNKDFMQTQYVFLNENCPIKVFVSRGVALVTELKKDDSSLYMLQNINNIKDGDILPVNYEIDFCNKNVSKVFFKGKQQKVEVYNNKLSVKLNCGDAVFITVNNQQREIL